MIKLPAPNQSAERGISRHIIKSTATQLYELNKLKVSTKEKKPLKKHFILMDPVSFIPFQIFL
jgi:hypothetical protein